MMNERDVLGSQLVPGDFVFGSHGQVWANGAWMLVAIMTGDLWHKTKRAVLFKVGSFTSDRGIGVIHTDYIVDSDAWYKVVR